MARVMCLLRSVQVRQPEQNNQSSNRKMASTHG